MARKQSLRTQLRNVTDKTKGGISSFVLRTKGGDAFYPNAVCYAKVVSVNPVKELVVSLDNHEYLIDSPKRAKVYREYAKYIFNSPCFGSSFKTKNVGIAFRYGFECDVSKPLSQIVASLTALREGVEFPEKLDVFDFLLKKGYSGDVAYILSSNFLFDVRNDNNVIVTIRSTGHRLICAEHPLSEIVQTLVKGYRDRGEQPYSKESRGFRCQLAFAIGNGNLLRDYKKYININDAPTWADATTTTIPEFLKLADAITTMIGQVK